MNTRVISSSTIDEIAKQILAYDLIHKIQIPTRIDPATTYDKGLEENYRPSDISGVKAILAKFAPTKEEMATMDSLLRWNFRNAGTIVRSSYGLIAAALNGLNKDRHDNDQSTMAVQVSDNLAMQFSQESLWAIKRMTRMTVATGAHECKIPLRDLDSEYAELIDMSKMFGTDVYDVEADTVKSILKDLTSTTPIDKTQNRKMLARKLCLQMIQAIAEYRQDDTFGRLRGFMNNVCHFANLVRILTTGENHSLNRLCCDVLDQVHSTDRLLNSNCIAAIGLMERIKNDEVVYDRILELGKHQHRVMALEVSSCVGLFAYLVKQSQSLIEIDSDVRNTLSRLLKYSGISNRYTSEINNKKG